MSLTFGQYIRSLRESAGLTQRALSQAVGFRSLAHLSDIESGKRHPARDVLPKFAEALGVPVAELESRDERGPIEALKALFAAKPEMVAVFLRIAELARSLDSDELLQRLEKPRAASARPSPAEPVPTEAVAPVESPVEATSAPKPGKREEHPTLF